MTVMTGEDPDLHFLTLEEAVRRTGISRFLLKQEIKAGALKQTRVGARQMIRESDLERFIEDLRSR